jgi:hypothetical protein
MLSAVDFSLSIVTVALLVVVRVTWGKWRGSPGRKRRRLLADVDVLHDPADPDSACIDRGVGNATTVFLLLGIGLAFGGVAWVFRRDLVFLRNITSEAR